MKYKKKIIKKKNACKYEQDERFIKAKSRAV